MVEPDAVPAVTDKPGGGAGCPGKKGSKSDAHTGIGSPILANTAALSWYTHRARMDDRYARWTAQGKNDFLRALARGARSSRYFARGFPHSWNNTSEEVWTTFHEGHSATQWRGTTNLTMEQGFQQLVPHQVPACASRPPTDRSRRCGRGSHSCSASGRSMGARQSSCTRTPSLCSSRPSCKSSRRTPTPVAVPTQQPEAAAGPPSQCSESSGSRLIRRLEILRHVSERPPAAGPVDKLDWEMFTALSRRTFDFEPIGKRVIHPTYVPGAKYEEKQQEEESDDD
mmetsp:Transcript_61255/g.143331  ORF Transcript_61255/g.143331 Transcript_61255/m.143331 type:complete len:284 (+) Transcript_61255:14-865(+)